MSPEMPLRLAQVEKDENDNFRLERRGMTRHNIEGRVTAVQIDTQPEGQVKRICSLQLLNISDRGLAAICQDPVRVNSSVAIFFPPHGPERGFDLVGTVVRCVPCPTGHEIGVRLAVRAAA
jgi:hypothetical protein